MMPSWNLVTVDDTYRPVNAKWWYSTVKTTVAWWRGARYRNTLIPMLSAVLDDKFLVVPWLFSSDDSQSTNRWWYWPAKEGRACISGNLTLLMTVVVTLVERLVFMMASTIYASTGRVTADIYAWPPGNQSGVAMTWRGSNRETGGDMGCGRRRYLLTAVCWRIYPVSLFFGTAVAGGGKRQTRRERYVDTGGGDVTAWLWLEVKQYRTLKSTSKPWSNRMRAADVK